ncbi:alpha/beta hydrolase fold domain-containing protein [Paenibacillus polymyxa]|uniref:alpha/beta hydrolase fold domain-containing protein n=1 Tax=Paenibacillus polymyxa TaxID=1406 RepID=UPI002024E6A5|nr:alpha/beta hydrolase fold domain-containing protein [Paenibacillus polymyxa]WGV33781.1 alpha/beta hydrolase fold domain-containing protein [Paenibacillus polymyxa]
MDFENRLYPEFRSVIAQFPGFQLEENLELSRSYLSSPPIEQSKHVRTTSRMIPSVAGEILVKIYEPAQRTDVKLPAMLWIHGGGYVMGHPDMDDALCERFVQAAKCVVVSVDYRLAPEHPYPAAIDDRSITASSHEITADNAPWNRKNNLAAWNMYLGDRTEDTEMSPYAVPSRAECLAGLPPTYTCIGQLDLFRDETIEYVARLARAGVDVDFHLYPGTFHNFEGMVPQAEVSQRASQSYVDAIARALNP